jgi:hypothetical protein
MIAQRSGHYQQNLRTIETYLNRIQRMMAPSDQNYSFNIKVMSDLTDLCNQLNKMGVDERHESILSKKIMTDAKTNDGGCDLVFSQSSVGDILIDDKNSKLDI